MTTQKQIADAIIEYLNQHRPPYKLDDSDRPTFVEMLRYTKKKLFPNGDAPDNLAFNFHAAHERLVRYSRPKNKFYLNKRVKS
jgi:hypothetical protein